MDFSQYLQDYMNIKRLQGVTPGRKTSTALFAPYFDRQFDVNMAGRKMNLAEQAQTSKEKQQGESLAWEKERTGNILAWNKEKTISDLALEKWQNQLMMNQAKRGDRNALIGNVFSTAGSLGSMALLKKYGYFDRRG